MPFVLVDTNIVSYELKRDTRARLYERHPDGQQRAIAFVTLAELHSWAELYGWGARLRSRLEATLADYLVLWPDADTCILWAEVTAICSRQGRRIEATDAWVAACALRYRLPLVTHNQRHFGSIPNLVLLSEGS